MNYTLMHQTVPVVDLFIGEDIGFIEKIGTYHNPEHLPVGLNDWSIPGDDLPSRKTLNEWWVGRSIPASRQDLEQVLYQLNIPSCRFLLTKSFGLSLSDHYWVKPIGTQLKWEDINFFHHDFSEDVGNILFGNHPLTGDINLMSPDNTSDGWLKKKWIIANDKRYLMKGGSGDYQQEPVNEVIATALMKRLNIEHIPYQLTFDNQKPYSLCENFVTPHTELVPAWRLMHLYKKSNNDSPYMHLLKTCERLGMDQIRGALEKMLTLDYLIANSDRHYNNFGFLRNPKTLEWLGFSPIFDSGTSLWHHTAFIGRKVESKPFKKTHAEQIKLVKDFSWIDFQGLKGIDQEIHEILDQSPYLETKRKQELVNAVVNNIKTIRNGEIK